MATATPPVTPPQSAPTADPAVFKILEDGTVLYKTYQQAAHAKQLQTATQAGDAVKKLSQVKYGEKYLTTAGQVVPYTLGRLVEFQLTGLIVVLLVLVGLSLICSLIGRLIKLLDRSAAELPVALSPAPSPPTATAATIHPGLTDQQLVVLLTAAATEAIGAPVRIASFRPANNKGGNWAAQGRSELQTHRLK